MGSYTNIVALVESTESVMPRGICSCFIRSSNFVLTSPVVFLYDLVFCV